MNTLTRQPATQALTIPRRLHNLRLDQDRTQQDIADQIGVTQASISGWESGQKIPRTHHAIAWAATLHHRLTVTRHGVIVADLHDLLPALARLRRTLGHTETATAQRMHVVDLSNIECRAARGRHLDLDTVDRYLHALDCRIGLHPCEVTPC
jgi:transcriptional regulator with XRE-family HTH domain